MKIYLASTSPRRKELLARIVSEFDTVSPDVEEKPYEEKTTKDKCIRRAKDKCVGAVNKIKDYDCVIIASDTAVDLDGNILDKPVDEADAYRMITDLQNNSHTVYTAVSVYYNGDMYTFCDETIVYISPIEDSVIREYIKTDEPYDKAGGYAIQGFMSEYIPRIDGDFYTVMGLPVDRLGKLLTGLGIV